MTFPQNPSVVFNYQTWVLRFPEFKGVPEALAQEYFDEAGLFYANCGWTGALPQARMLLNLLTAHIAALNAPLGGKPSSSVVGRVSSAHQGSVSVQTDAGDANASSPSQWWFMQTKYGAEFWQATIQFRSGRYVPPPWPGSRVPSAFFGGRRVF